MGYIRVIHQHFYDPDRGRFQSLAFRPSSDDSGISIIDEECVLRTSPSICDHIEKFYHDIAGNPPIFWIFYANILPEACKFIQQTSDSGDECHHNLIGLTDKQARNIFKQVTLNAFRICTANGDHRPLDQDDVESFE